MKPGKKILAAKIFLAMALSASPVMMAPAHATGIPVFDAGNLTQNVMTAMESVAQTLKQIEQYRTQLQQYENMLRNTAAPAAYIWDQAVTTMNLLRGAIDTLDYYKANLGSIDNYLGKFQDVAYYRGSPCFSAAGCSDAERAAMEHYIKAGHGENKPLMSTAQWGKQTVYRHMEPIRLMPPCLPCHGKPKGELDIVNFEKDGLETGDLIGLMSVTIAVKD